MTTEARLMLNDLTFNALSNLTEEEARAQLERIRWPDGPVCPRCESADVVAINGKSKSVRPGL